MRILVVPNIYSPLGRETSNGMDHSVYEFLSAASESKSFSDATIDVLGHPESKIPYGVNLIPVPVQRCPHEYISSGKFSRSWELIASEAAINQLAHAFNGYTLGVGLDYAFTDLVFGRLEYRYTDFGDKDFNLGGATLNSDVDQHAIRVGLGVKF